MKSCHEFRNTYVETYLNRGWSEGLAHMPAEAKSHNRQPASYRPWNTNSMTQLKPQNLRISEVRCYSQSDAQRPQKSRSKKIPKIKGQQTQSSGRQAVKKCPHPWEDTAASFCLSVFWTPDQLHAGLPQWEQIFLTPSTNSHRETAKNSALPNFLIHHNPIRFTPKLTITTMKTVNKTWGIRLLRGLHIGSPEYLLSL